MTLVFGVTKVKEIMTPNPVLIGPDATLQEAAEKMESVCCGVLPVGTEDMLTGIITDRDIVVRAIAMGVDPVDEKVSKYMTSDVHACNEDDSLEEAAEKMRRYKVSRLVVRDMDGKMTGILSFGCIFRSDASPQEIAGVVKRAAGPVCVSR